MAVQRNDPYPGMNFLVDIGTGETESTEAGLLEVIFPEARVHVLEYRNGNERVDEVRKTRSITRYGNLILKRGAIGALTWYVWWNAVRNGDVNSKRNIDVQLLSEDREDVVMRWRFLRAWPVRHQFAPLHAVNPGVLIETLEIAFERLEME